jgi:predicted RNA-binding protein YlqC (UPF0109 family)
MRASRQTAQAVKSWNRSGDSLQDLLLYMVQQLVDVPALVAVSATQGQHTLILKVTVVPSDRGKVIGKKGRIADALRTILSAAAGKQGKRALIEIIEEPPGRRQ